MDFIHDEAVAANDTYRTWAEIDLSALKANLDYAKRISGKPVICVIKADAYGHGAVTCGRFLEKNGAAMFAVACIEEAIELREGGITLPILILGYTPACFAEQLAKYDIEQTVVDFSHAAQMSRAALLAGVTVKVHIKLDTGMGRCGLYAQGQVDKACVARAIDDAEQIYLMDGLDAVGMFTHFAVADTPSQDAYTSAQFESYKAVREGLAERGIVFKKCHVSNSAAIMEHSEVHFDYVREGIMLYGMYPDSQPRDGELRPVMTLKSRVAQIRDLPKGTSVSYGRTFMTERDMQSAVITVGYADGYPRRLSNNATITINGKAYPQVGRICMDMCMADVTGGDVKRGDEAVLFGNGGMNIEVVSQIVGTINYELTCLVTRRAHRVYING